jgi:hypothetical protein
MYRILILAWPAAELQLDPRLIPQPDTQDPLFEFHVSR